MNPPQPPVKSVYFGSNAVPPWNLLSNFHLAEFRFMPAHVVPEMTAIQPYLKQWLGQLGRVFSSSEALWQSLKATDEATFLEFTDGGHFDVITMDFFAMMMPKSAEVILTPAAFNTEVKRKCDYWLKKMNVGIVSKLAGNRAHADKLGLKGHMNYNIERLPIATERAIWLAILVQKFRQHTESGQLLLGSGDVQLVEFDRGASTKPEKVHWGGYICDDGSIKGENVMGRYLMEVRAHLINEIHEEIDAFDADM